MNRNADFFQRHFQPPSFSPLARDIIVRVALDETSLRMARISLLEIAIVFYVHIGIHRSCREFSKFLIIFLYTNEKISKYKRIWTMDNVYLKIKESLCNIKKNNVYKF